MCSSAKRLKLDNNKLKWNAVLADEFVTTKFSYVTFLKAQVIDNKMISFLVESLNQLHSLSHLKFKRIKKLLAAPSSPPTFELLISAKNDFKPLPANLNDMLTNLSEIELPVNNILTKEQFEIVSKQYWPVSFHLNKYIESLLDQSYFNKQVLDKLDFYSKLALHMAVFKQSRSAAIIVDQRTDLIVASGIDCRSSNPLTHATVDALNNVAVRHIKEINKITSNQNQAEIFKSQEHLNSFIESEASQEFAQRAGKELNKKLDPNDYLCKNYAIFLTHEPCSMCAMALIHARITKVYYIFPTSHGHLNTKCKLHCNKSLNHSFETFRAADVDQLDDPIINHFN